MAEQEQRDERVPTAEQLAAWKQDPVTEQVLSYLRAWRGQLLEYLGEGGTTAWSIEATALRTAEAVSKAQMLKDILRLKAEDIAKFYMKPQRRKEKAK